MGKHWPLFKPPVLPLRITLHAGQRIAPTGQAAADIAAQFEHNVRAHFHTHAHTHASAHVDS